METQRGIKYTAPLILSLGARWRRLLTSRSDRFSPVKELQYAQNMKSPGPQSRSERLRDEKTRSSLA